MAYDYHEGERSNINVQHNIKHGEQDVYNSDGNARRAADNIADVVTVLEP